MDVVAPLREVVGVEVTFLSTAVGREGKGMVRSCLVVLHGSVRPCLVTFLEGGLHAIELIGTSDGPRHAGLRQTVGPADAGDGLVTRCDGIVRSGCGGIHARQDKAMVVPLLKVPDHIVCMGRQEWSQPYTNEQDGQDISHLPSPSKEWVARFLQLLRNGMVEETVERSSRDRHG